jgi:hypothetical protein
MGVMVRRLFMGQSHFQFPVHLHRLLAPLRIDQQSRHEAVPKAPLARKRTELFSETKRKSI